MTQARHFETTFGFSNYDECYDIIELSSGDIVAAGYSGSGGLGEADFFLQSMSPDGSDQWNGFYGGADFDQCYSVVEDGDGSLFLGGFSSSWGLGYTDYLVVKLNASGDQLWSKTFGSIGLERAYDMICTPDNNLLLSGSFQADPRSTSGVGIMSLNSNGEELWQAHFDGPNEKVIRSTCLTEDNQMVLAGWSNAGAEDEMLLVKIDSQGELLWEKSFGSTGTERCHDIVLCLDGGFLLAGYQFIDFEKNRELYMVKTDAQGNQLWDLAWGGELNDEAWAVEQDPSGALFIAGFSESFSVGGNDACLLKVSEFGVPLGHKSFGGISHVYSRAMHLASNGDILLGGYTYSSGAGLNDYYIIRTDSTVNPL